MKILHIIQRYSPAIGGSELWCRNICSFLAKKGVVTDVFTMNLYNIEESNRPLSLDEQCIKLGEYDYDNEVFVQRHALWPSWKKSISSYVINFLFRVFRLEKTDIGNIFRHSPHSFKMYLRLPSAIKRCDLVHLHTLPYFHNLVAFYIAKLYKKKIVITPHFHPGHKAYERRIFYKIMDGCDAVIAVSNYEKKYLIEKNVAGHKIFVTGNALLDNRDKDERQIDIVKKELFEKHDIDVDSKKILFIGRKELYKGILELIEAAREIASEEDINLSLFLAGPDSSEFIKIRRSCLCDMTPLKLIDFGIVSDVEKEVLLQSCDLLALPSLYEAFGIVFLEAWKHGKPVIGSRLGAVPEVIKGAGLLVNWGDMKDLKSKIKMLLFNDKLSLELGSKGRQKVDTEYSLDTIGMKLFNIYHELLKDRKRVLIVSSLFPPYCYGGAEQVAYEQSRQLKRAGFDVSVFGGMLDDSRPQYHIKIENNGFKIIRINLHAIDFKEIKLKVRREAVQGEFKKLLRLIAPDIVHFHNIDGFPLGVIEECHNIHIPTVMTLHDYWWICYKKALLKRDGSICDGTDKLCLDCDQDIFMDGAHTMTPQKRNQLLRRYLSKVDLLIAPSRYLADRFIDKGIAGNRIRVINNGIDSARFNGVMKTKSKKMRFGYIGVIKQHKGIENLLRAAAFLREEGISNFSLLVTGKGDPLFVSYCKDLVNKLKLGDFVSFAGEINNKNIGKIYKKIDALILPSIWPENCPMTIMEALTARIPVLASDIGGVRELVQDRVHGYLHKHDDPVSLKDNMLYLIKNPHVAEGMGEACLEKVRGLSLENQVRAIVDEYNKLIWK